MTQITLELNHAQAEALAQLVKRITYTAVDDLAQDEDETRLMMAAIEELRKALADAGHAPR